MEHKEGEFKGKGGLNLYWQAWLPPQPPRVILLVVHGLAEHSGRYGNLVDHFVPLGYGVCSFDLRGHGRSQGLRCYTDRFSDYAEDLRTFHNIVRERHRAAKIFLVGHSMGATIALQYAATFQKEMPGLILSAAVVKPGASVTRLQIVLARVLSALAPKMGVAPIDSSAISRDPAVVKAYESDRLVYRGKITARVGAEFIRVMQKELPSQIKAIELPLLIVYGSEDRLGNPEGSEMIYSQAKTKDKTIRRYDAFYHEVFNEPGRQRVFQDVGNWIAAHI